MVANTLPQVRKNIFIKGARLHNLKNIDVAIPRNKLVVITGLSGSGKSSLAFDTLYAEGQRRYVESLSSYARQFLGRLSEPKVDYIKGIAPAIAIEQKVNSTNPRSTVGTTTEIYDYLKLLFARAGQTFSPISGKEVKKHSVSDVINHVKTCDQDKRLLLLSPINSPVGRNSMDTLKVLSSQGFARIKFNGKVQRIEESFLNTDDSFELVIDRVVVKDDEAFYNRLADSVETAFFEGKGICFVEDISDGTRMEFSNLFEADGIRFLPPNTHMFSFNNPYGACPRCEGYGDVMGIDPGRVIPNTGLSVFEGAIFAWKGESKSRYKDELIRHARKFDFPIHRPWHELTQAQKELVWKGNEYFTGLNDFFTQLEAKSYKIQNRVMLSRYRGKTRCPMCEGKRLRAEASYVKIAGKSLSELVDLPIKDLAVFFKELKLDETRANIAKRLLQEINNRLGFLSDVGLNYLTLNRRSRTLSGGESQRINLATSLGSSLVGSMYILDEPSIGLHSKDTERLISVLRYLRDLGNTVIVVEHDEELMKAADYILDIGPEAGTGGGKLVASGTYSEILKSNTLTARYLKGDLNIEVPEKRRTSKNFLEITGAREHNLKNIDLKIPLDVLTVITGVSGSGKSTLVRNIVYPIMQKETGGYGDRIGEITTYSGKTSHIKAVEFIDQNPIGRSSRSNPVTYIKAYDDIRLLFSRQKLSKVRDYKSRHFSFNVDGGRCENCKGEGELTIEMQFMADVHLECDVCKGRRFKDEVLEVTFEGKNIDQVLNMTIADALEFFRAHKQERIAKKLSPLFEVGLGYVTLGQSSSTLSGGEAQRIKLATFLVKGINKEKVLFIFDEPTTGLHFHDISKLLASFNALIRNGHTVLVIEHNLELIKNADYILDLGPGGGGDGGYLVASGTPEEVARSQKSVTAPYLKEKLPNKVKTTE